MNNHLRSGCLAGLTLLWLGVPVLLHAQDEAAPAKPAKTSTAKTPAAEAIAPTPAELQAEVLRQRSVRKDQEIRSRLENTVWNDLDLRAGQPGQVWMFHPPVQHGNKEVRDWYLNDDVKLPRIGSWQVKNQELLLYALNGSLIGKGTYENDEINGKFIDPDRKKEFGKFQLREETKRNYRVLPLKIIKPTLGK